MKTGHWVLISLAVWVASFAAGFAVSKSTGVQPGYFEAAEAGGYGGGETSIEGIDQKMQDHYKNLYKNDE